MMRHGYYTIFYKPASRRSISRSPTVAYNVNERKLRMESVKPYVGNLIPLTTLAAKVREFADLCNPDLICTPNVMHDVKFVAVDYDDEEGSDMVGSHVLLELNGTKHLFTDWSRLQVLSHLGTREKWFAAVSRRQEAAELTERVHTFAGHRLRTMRSQEEGISLLRGFVSKEYAEIPDTDIMTALLELLPNGQCIDRLSEKTDRALYAYVIAGETPIGIRGKMVGYPGVVMKNSEVGFTSLWLIPFLYVELSNGEYRPMAFRQKALLRRVHRGSVSDLRADFDKALSTLSAVWKDVTERLAALRDIVFASEDEAVERLRSSLSALKETRAAVLEYERAYRAARHTLHTGLGILQTVLTTVRATTADASYVEAELAGALLLRLL
jgi:hypothetical protein